MDSLSQPAHRRPLRRRSYHGLARGERLALFLLALYALLALGYALGGNGFLEAVLILSLTLSCCLHIGRRLNRRRLARKRRSRRRTRIRAYREYETLGWR